jgi:hypothetical protein
MTYRIVIEPTADEFNQRLLAVGCIASDKLVNQGESVL